MKKVFTIISLLVFYCGFSQTIDNQVKAIADASAQKKVDSLAATLDVIIDITTSQAGAFNIDTIVLSANTSAMFQISITGTSGTNVGSAVKIIVLRNNNGIYTIQRASDIMAFSGITGAFWGVLTINNGAMVVIKVTGLTTPILWKYKRQSL